MPYQLTELWGGHRGQEGISGEKTRSASSSWAGWHLRGPPSQTFGKDLSPLCKEGAGRHLLLFSLHRLLRSGSVHSFSPILFPNCRRGNEPVSFAPSRRSGGGGSGGRRSVENATEGSEEEGDPRDANFNGTKSSD